jgi:raffinose/stachyose/melibiose transport system permease protein
MVFILFPIYLTVVSAFKSQEELSRSYLTPPKGFYLENFKEVFLEGGFIAALYNSVFITTISLILIITVIPMLAYALERNSGSRGYRLAFIYVLLGIFIPFQIVMLPVVKIMANIKLLNRLGLIVVYLGMSVPKVSFLYFGYVKSIPLELEESAFIDGASVFKIFTRIVYPLLKPMTASVIILFGLWIWNDFIIPLIILNKESRYWTLPLFQYNFMGEFLSRYNLVFAAFLLSMLPIILLYIFMQKHIMKGLTEGATKG